jgi:hypothetical protein
MVVLFSWKRLSVDGKFRKCSIVKIHHGIKDVPSIVALASSPLSKSSSSRPSRPQVKDFIVCARWLVLGKKKKKKKEFGEL